MTSPAEAIPGLYERHADTYDRLRGRSLFEKAWLDAFLALAPAGGSILDIGCGCGEPIARYVIEKGFRVSGIDSAPSLIALCRERFADHDWRVGDMRELDLGRGFQGVLAWDSFFHLSFEDQRRMFPIFAAHAEPGAPLMFTSGPEHGEAIGTFGGEALYHASLSPDEYRALLASHGFHVIKQVVEDPDCGGHTVWLARKQA